jgi:hypothetical protein
MRAHWRCADEHVSVYSDQYTVVVRLNSVCVRVCAGANLGQSSVRALLAGAATAVAVEGWHETAAVGESLAQLVNLAGLRYVRVNFNTATFDLELDRQVPGSVDIVMLLAIYRNVGLDHRDRMLGYALRRASRAVVIEGHADAVLDSAEYYYWVLKQHGAVLVQLDHDAPECLPHACCVADWPFVPCGHDVVMWSYRCCVLGP